MSKTIIEVKSLSKVYKLYNNNNDRIKESINIFGKKYSKEFYALKDITFSIKQGENIGIIGKNGSGKSTLLKILTGLLTPTNGYAKTNGKVAALLELGAGFNPEYTGLNNIYLKGMIMGYTKEEMDNKINNIISFADIGDFINQPVKTYSSGMFARLAFAVSINVDPEILIVDEALSVGDIAFQHKCINKMKEMINNGTTILFVSHDVGAIKSFCSRCIYLDNGQIKADGDAIDVTDLYIKDIRTDRFNIKKSNYEVENIVKDSSSRDSFVENLEFEKRVKDIRYGSGGAKIKNVYMVNSKSEVRDTFDFNEEMSFIIHVEAYKDIQNFNCCILIRDKNGIDIMGTTTFEENIKFPGVKKGNKLIIKFKCPNLLKHNMTYSVGVTINDTERVETQEVLDEIDLTCNFKSNYNEKRPVWYAYHQDFEIDYEVIE